MRWIWGVGLVVLAGCAAIEEGRQVSTIADVDVKGRDKVCVRQCLDMHATCSGRAAMSDGDVNNRRVLATCKSNYQMCVKTC